MVPKWGVMTPLYPLWICPCSELSSQETRQGNVSQGENNFSSVTWPAARTWLMSKNTNAIISEFIRGGVGAHSLVPVSIQWACASCVSPQWTGGTVQEKAHTIVTSEVKSPVILAKTKEVKETRLSGLTKRNHLRSRNRNFVIRVSSCLGVVWILYLNENPQQKHWRVAFLGIYR